MDIKTLIIGGIIIFTALVVFIVLFIFLYQKRYYRHLQEKEQLKVQFQQELLQTQLEIQEQTLKTISQEIHDNIGQVLSLAKLNLNTMDITKPEEIAEKITNSKNLVGNAIQDLRDLSRTLNTDSIESMGLNQAIEYELELISKTKAFITNLKVQGEIQKLDSQKELILFRIVQEALHNIIKHAMAKNINVTLNYSDNRLELFIADNGKGFNLTSLNEGTNTAFGMGIRNMHNRAKLINADFSISSIIGKGTEVRLTMPMNN